VKGLIIRNIPDAEIESCESLPHLEYIEKELTKIFSPVLPMWSASTVA
jgi:hypothetical protein